MIEAASFTVLSIQSAPVMIMRPQCLRQNHFWWGWFFQFFFFFPPLAGDLTSAKRREPLWAPVLSYYSHSCQGKEWNTVRRRAPARPPLQRGASIYHPLADSVCITKDSCLTSINDSLVFLTGKSCCLFNLHFTPPPILSQPPSPPPSGMWCLKR